MNVAYFLLPKHQVVCCFEDNTFRQGLEKMKHHGYSAIPVLSRSGKYLGTVSEGDFLWKLLEGDAGCGYADIFSSSWHDGFAWRM